jgi:Tol biopolymer transport system component
MARFQREAEVLASLNHPNIAHIYGVEERALAMELVEGPTLPSGLPLETALHYARQIAEALEYAHERGVIHRDLKPANIKITPEGAVKLLDFGLAKATDDQSGSGDNPDNSPTLTLGATRVGVILGTAAYMSPEQASGKPADRRADIWSFGAVLYEMLAGKKAFDGESVSDTLASVLKLDPDWSALPSSTPAGIRNLIRRCLTKDRKQRLQAIGEARIVLESPAAEASAPIHASRGSRLGILATVAAGILALVAAGLGWIAWRATRPVEHKLVRLEVDLGSDISLAPPNSVAGTVILSPDGTRLVYSASVAGGQPRLFTRRLDQPKATELPGTEGAIAAFFSPDGQWIGFATANRINKISVQGGAVVPLASVTIFGGATWGEDGNLVVSEPLGRGLLSIPSAGGSATVLTGLTGGDAGLSWPQILPGGKALLFTSVTDPTAGGDNIEVFSLADHRRKTVAHGGTSAHYLPVSSHGGYLVYTNQGTMFAVPFDLDKLETYRNAVPVLDDVAHATSPEAGQFDYSPSGTLVYRTGGGGTGPAMSTIQWVDAAGKRQALQNRPGAYGSLRFSPDGRRLAMTVTGASGPDIWVYDPQRDASIRLTFGGAFNAPLAWSPDGRYVVFGSVLKGLQWTRSDGAGQPQPLVPGNVPLIPFSFSSDGKRLAYYGLGSGRPQIWTVPVEESGAGLKGGTPEQFLKDQFTDVSSAFSPDGRWLAYESNATGNFEVYVRPFPPPASGEGGQWQISNGGGAITGMLAWSRTSHELYYQAGDQILAVSYTVQDNTFVPDKPRVWISKVGGTQWDLAPDGKRVAMITPVGSGESPAQDHTVVFLLNFLDYLKQQVPLNR